MVMERVGVFQAKLGAMKGTDAFVDRWSNILAQAARLNVKVLVFPEYGWMDVMSYVSSWKEAEDAYENDLSPLFAQYAATHDALVVGPSGLRKDAKDPSHWVNASNVYTSKGVHRVSKCMMTPFEKTAGVGTGDFHSRVFTLGSLVVGVVLCYESEFPEYVRPLAKDGVHLVVVPSFTSSYRGMHRVHLAARARALENQFFVAVSQAVQGFPKVDMVDQGVGFGAIYGPPDIGFPENGILSTGAVGQEGWVIWDLSKESLRQARQEGEVRNYEDWINNHNQVS